MATDAMADCVFPEEIMLCILTLLPLKPIGRFKSVCKPWLNLLSSPEFIKSHRTQFSNDPKNESFILYRFNDNGENSTVSLFNEKTKPTILDRPLGDVDIDVVGCCNGLVCIFEKNVFGRADKIVLWNPALKLSKTLSSSPSIDCGDREMVSLGFGYDAEADDYKVVRIVCLRKRERGEEIIKGVEVYSVNSDSWATIEPGFQFRVHETRSNAIVNGKPYWVALDVYGNESAKNRFGEVLVCFDATKLVFQIVPLTNCTYMMDAQLVDLNGSLAACVLFSHTDYDEDSKGDLNGDHSLDGSLAAHVLPHTHYDEDSDFDGDVYEDHSLDVWVFDEGERIWRKKHSFVPPNIELGGFQHILKNGNLLVSRRDSRLYLVDPIPEIECVEKLFYGARKHDSFQVYVYTESLTSVKGMVTTVGEKNKAGDGASSSKRKGRFIRSRLHGLKL